MRLKENSDETVPVELIFQSILGTDIQRQKANMRLSRQGVPPVLRQRCRHRGVEVRSELGSAAARCQRKQQFRQNAMQPSPFHTARVDETNWTRRRSNSSSFDLPVGWNMLHTANDLLQGADYAAGFIGGAQIGAINYRQSLPVNSRVLSFSKFAQYYRGLGKLGKGLGRAGAAGTVITTYLDYKAMQQGQIGTGRFIYRTTGTVNSIVSSIYVGMMFGGPYGVAAGLVVGLAFVGGEIAYDQVSRLVDELTEGIADMERALSTGTWVPSF